MKNKDKIKILFIHHSMGWGGAPKSLIELINGIDKTKYEVEVLLLKKSIVAKKLYENNIAYYISDSSFYKKYYHFFPHSEAGYVKLHQIYKIITLGLKWILSHNYYATQELDKFNYDMVHLNSSVLTDWIKPAKAKGKVILHVREPFRKGRFDILHYLFRLQMDKYADKIIAISRDNAKRIALPLKTEVIYNFTKISRNLSNIESYYSKKVLYVGGSDEIKGFYAVIKALNYLDEDIKVLFCGYYEMNEKSSKGIKNKIKKILPSYYNRKNAIEIMKSNSKAIEIGLIDNIESYLHKVSCLISPFSLPHFSRPIIEAYACKKPVVASNVAGMTEIVDNYETGILVENGNSIELARAINYLCNNPKISQQFGEAGFNKFESNYSVSNITQFEAIYDQLSHNQE
jgi:glycosyltransferase involved in cell wall biosynthesis